MNALWSGQPKNGGGKRSRVWDLLFRVFSRRRVRYTTSTQLTFSLGNQTAGWYFTHLSTTYTQAPLHPTSEEVRKLSGILRLDELWDKKGKLAAVRTDLPNAPELRAAAEVEQHQVPVFTLCEIQT